MGTGFPCQPLSKENLPALKGAGPQRLFQRWEQVPEGFNLRPVPILPNLKTTVSVAWTSNVIGSYSGATMNLSRSFTPSVLLTWMMLCS